MAVETVRFELDDGVQGPGIPPETLWADAVVSEKTDHQASPTLLPVEGRFITDHVIQNPDLIEMEMVISDTPLVGSSAEWAGMKVHSAPGSDFEESTVELEGQGNNFIQVPGSTPTRREKLKFQMKGVNQNPQRSTYVFIRLLQAKENATILTVLTSLGLWKNCVITRLSVTRNKPESAVIVSIQFMNLRFVETSTGEFTAQRRKPPRATAETDKGKQEERTPGPQKSLLAGGVDALARGVDVLSFLNR